MPEIVKIGTPKFDFCTHREAARASLLDFPAARALLGISALMPRMTLASRVGAIFLFAPVLLLVSSFASLTANPHASRRVVEPEVVGPIAAVAPAVVAE